MFFEWFNTHCLLQDRVPFAENFDRTQYLVEKRLLNPLWKLHRCSDFVSYVVRLGHRFAASLALSPVPEAGLSAHFSASFLVVQTAEHWAREGAQGSLQSAYSQSLAVFRLGSSAAAANLAQCCCAALSRCVCCLLVNVHRGLACATQAQLVRLCFAFLQMLNEFALQLIQQRRDARKDQV
jgi:hypothetical protein